MGILEIVFNSRKFDLNDDVLMGFDNYFDKKSKDYNSFCLDEEDINPLQNFVAQIKSADSDSVIYVSTYGYEITNSKGEKSTYADALWIDTVLPISQIESSDAKETAKDSTYKEVKENAAEKESKPAKKENVKPKKETDGEMKKDSGQEEKKEEKDNSKREAVLTDPVTMGWAGTYKDDDSGDRLVIASIGYEWSYVIYTSSGQIFEKESECGAFGDYLEGQYYTFYKNENGLLSVTSGAGKGWGNYRRISGTYTPDLEIEGTYENDTTTMIVYDQMAEASTKYVPTGSDIAAVRVEYNNGLVIDGRLYTQGDGGLSIIDSVSKEIYGIATFENGEVKVTGSGFDGILKSK